MSVLDGKAVIVTGAGRGIGAALAHHAAGLGAKVVVNDIEAALAEGVAAAIEAAGGTASAAPLDITDWDGAARLVDMCGERFGAVDGLVNNAAILRREVLEEAPEASWRAVTEVNVLGTAFCLSHAVRAMKRQGSGSIVNVTSGAQHGLPHMAAYGASKGAVAALTYCAAVELEGTGVRVNAVSPKGATRMMSEQTRFLRSRGVDAQERAGPDPAQNAPAICYLLSDHSRHLNGQILRVDDDSLSIVSHPVVLEPSVREERWSVEAVRAAVEGPLRGSLQPLGVFSGRLTLRS